MKILYCDDYKLGVLNGESVVDVSSVVRGIPHTGPHDLINGLIERFAEFRPKLEEAAGREKGVPVADVKIRPPLPRPISIDCMAGIWTPPFVTICRTFAASRSDVRAGGPPATPSPPRP